MTPTLARRTAPLAVPLFGVVLLFLACRQSSETRPAVVLAADSAAAPSAATSVVEQSVQQATVAAPAAARPRVASRAETYISRAARWVGFARDDTRGAEERPTRPEGEQELGTEQYDRIVENPFLEARANPLSTFSIDVDRAAYANVRRFITAGERPPRDAVRIEELVNYFPYEYHAPEGGHPFAVTTEVASAPWNREHRLLRITLQGRRMDESRLPPSNLVFLIDVSGSMSDENKLPLVQQAFRLLVDQLRPVDRVAIVVYAGSAGLVLPSTPGDRKAEILAAIDRLQAGGSTAGGEGIVLAYRVAKEHFITGGNNRVILATDGDFNVGVSSDGELTRLIEQKREEGTFLTVLGFGTGNLKDSRMEQLADRGNGNYAYVDDLGEARKVFVHEFGGTMFTIAKDVKLQVEFNPARVAAYRLLGYENRVLRSEDFDDDRKDAGELGAGHTVTALYEVIPAGARTEVAVRGLDSLRYQHAPAATAAAGGEELLFVKLRYKEPSAATSRLLTHAVADRVSEPSTDFAFATAVAEFGLLMRDSQYRGSASLEDVIARAERAKGDDEGGYRAEFVELARKVDRMRLVAAR